MSTSSTEPPSVTWPDVTSVPHITGQYDVPNVTEQLCGNHTVPTTQWLFLNLSSRRFILLITYGIIAFLTLIVYIDECIFISRRFKRNPERCQKTLWVLAVFPMFSITGLLGYMVPMATPVVDLVSNTFMATCLYNMVELMMCYLGGTQGLWELVEENQLCVQYATLPVCCVLPCLPKQKLNKLLLSRLRMMVLQVCIIRPILMFLAAVMWANGTYTHSGMSLHTADPYITFTNVTTTMIAVYGLNLVKTALIRPLRGFWIGGKVFIIQMVLATCSLTPVFTRMFDKLGWTRCDPIFIKSVHLDGIYRGVLVVSMFLYSLTARFLYRRATDADKCVKEYIPEPEIDWKTNMKRILNMPREAILYFNHRKRKSTENQNGHIPSIHDEHLSFIDSPKSWSSRKSNSMESTIRYMDDTVDETTSLTLEIIETDTEDNNNFGVLHVNVNESMVNSD